ncbi:MAG: hypothetical protein K0S02_3346 [Achromobacter mucicolens]|jgi:hypothetical protein|uniref:tetratricopeptide repeat protein n=1 Tax=Achromobacter mucicolens TaxID=1389922 RepID=UPI002431AE14|nr:hypothetical protein [Achromobacter mucicolens]MDF2863074.1 hypothetical protein [Achromobacter mucicolens]
MRFPRLVVLAGVVAVMAGCASVKPQSESEYKQSMAEAEKALEQKSADQAVAQFEEIAVRNPSKGLPWSYIAKIRFDEQKYGQAIVAADEALSRDPDDFVAKSVRAVGGLRVAMQSLADLRADALLAGNARADAVALAAAMRETLGQDVLFPEGRRPPPRPRQPPRKADPAPASASPSSAAATGAAPAASTSAAPKVTPSAAPGAASNASPAATQPAQQPNRAPNPFGDLLTK